MRARLTPGGIGQPNARTGAAFHKNRMAMVGQFAHAFRRQADAEFLGFDFPDCADPHNFSQYSQIRNYMPLRNSHVERSHVSPYKKRDTEKATL